MLKQLELSSSLSLSCHVVKTAQAYELFQVHDRIHVVHWHVAFPEDPARPDDDRVIGLGIDSRTLTTVGLQQFAEHEL